MNALTRNSTDFLGRLGSSLPSDPVSRRQGRMESLEPVLMRLNQTTISAPDAPEGTAIRSNGRQQRKYIAPLPNASVQREVRADSAPIHNWEGTVISVDDEAFVMHVMLVDKLGSTSRHTGEIFLDEVSAQDMDLVRPGAVFYLTFYKRTVPSTENVQELRFRRRPTWTAAQLKRVEQDASLFLSKMKTLPTVT